MSDRLLREHVVALLAQVASGEIAPRQGGARIWALMAEADYPAEVDEFRVVVGFVSEMEDDPEHEDAYAADLLAYAREATGPS